ncbi:MAG: hypothetical protein DRP64_03940 [Verrucomicrobia bacterium]|nr:MAG: hypothetical protein DRP64_03940 [Verrucomicrobiota bacterium]
MTQPNSIKPLAKGDAPNLVGNEGYVAFIRDVKQRIQSSQIKAAVKVNQELLLLYWDLGNKLFPYWKTLNLATACRQIEITVNFTQNTLSDGLRTEQYDAE